MPYREERRRGRPIKRGGGATPLGGYKGGRGVANFSGANECYRCGRDMENIADMMPSPGTRGGWIHKTCASGQDDA